MKRIVVLLLALLLAFGAVNALRAEDEKELKKQLDSAISSGDMDTVKRTLSALARVNTPKAAEIVCDAIPKIAGRDIGVLETLKLVLKTFSGDKVMDVIYREARRSKSNKTQVILAEVIGELGGEKGVDVLCKLLRDRDDGVVKTAARALGNLGDKRAVKSLIDALKKHKRKKDGPYWDINTALQKISGKAFQEHVDWVNWYKDGKGLEDCHPEHYTPGLGVAKREKFTTFFGLRIDSRRLIIIVDTSGSMKAVDPLPEGGRSAGPSTGTEEEIKRREKELEEEMKKLGKERQRIVRAKAELVLVIKSLHPSVKFNIVAYSDSIRTWKKKLTEANDKNKESALAFAKSLEAGGLTHTDDALETAFKDKDVDTIIIVSDGAPTHIGGGGGRHMPEDSQMIIDHIIQWTRENNRFRKVIIHSLGFLGANREFMEQLAKENGGTFRDIE